MTDSAEAASASDAVDETALLSALQPPVLRFLRRALQDPEAAEDAAGEALLVVLADLRRGTPIRDPLSYALGVAWRKSHEAFRARKRRRATAWDEALPEPAQRDDRAGGDAREWLETALARLSPEDRALIALRFEDGRTYREIGEILGVSVALAGWRLHRARERLRDHLRESGGGERLRAVAAILPALRGGGLVLRATAAASVAAAAALCFVLLPPAPESTPPRAGGADVSGAPPAVAAASEGPSGSVVGRPYVDEEAAPPPSTAPTPASADRRPRLIYEGLVRDDSGRPIAGAEASFRRSFGGPPAGADDPPPVRTDAAGRFRFELVDDPVSLPLTRVQLTLTAPGFLATSTPGVEVFENGTDGDRPRYFREFTLRAANPLRGRVLDALTNAPLPDARVSGAARRKRADVLLGGPDDYEAAPFGGPVVTEADAEGRFSLGLFAPQPDGVSPAGGVPGRPALAPRTLFLAAAPGYAPALYVASSAFAATPIACDARLAPAFKLRGRVVFEDGAPAAFEPLLVTADGSPLGRHDSYPAETIDRFTCRFERSATCDAEGRYALDDLPAGLAEAAEWRVFSAADPRRSVLVTAPTAAGAPPVAAPDLALPTRPAPSRFRVRDARGEPIRNANIVLAPTEMKFPLGGGFAIGAARTDESGVGRIEWTAAPTPGQPYRLRIDAPGFIAFEESADPTLREREVTLREGPVFEGRVLDAAGKPVAGLRVVAEPLTPQTKTAPTFGATDLDGRFVIRAPDGETPHRLSVREPRSRAEETGPPRSTPAARPGPAPASLAGAVLEPVVPPARDLVLSFTTPPCEARGSLVVRLRGLPEEAPAGSPTITLYRDGAVMETARAFGANGGAFFGVPAGRYEVRALRGTWRGTAVVEAPARGMAEAEIVLTEGIVVRGTARGPRGPLAGAEVRVRNGSGEIAASARVAADGTFLISGAPPYGGVVEVEPTPCGEGRCWAAAAISYHRSREDDPEPSDCRFVAQEAVRRKIRLVGMNGVGAAPSTLRASVLDRQGGLVLPLTIRPDPERPADGVSEAWLPMGALIVRTFGLGLTRKDTPVTVGDDAAEIAITTP